HAQALCPLLMPDVVVELCPPAAMLDLMRDGLIVALEIIARAKIRTRSLQNDGMNAIILVHFPEQPVELFHQRFAERVSFLRPVQRNPRCTVPDLAKDQS